MDWITLVLLAVGLAMDAFAGAICKGLALKKVSVKDAAVVGSWFGGFQGLMPVIGYLMGVHFQDTIVAVDHWIAAIFLGAIGINMICDAFDSSPDQTNGLLNFKTMAPLAVATSIDALTVGVTFAFLKVEIITAALVIGGITFALSMLGVWVGSVAGSKYQSKAEFAGGTVLILMGIKILLEHLGIL